MPRSVFFKRIFQAFPCDEDMMKMMKKTGVLLPVIAFIALGSIWGSNFLYMKITAQFITPVQILFLRILIGVIPVFIYALVTRSMKPEHFRYIHRFTIMALFNAVIYLYAFIKGTTLLYSGIAGALSGSVPLFSFILGVLFIKEEKMSLLRVGGIVMGIIGVALIANPSGGDVLSANPEGLAYMIGGCISFGFAFVYARKYIVPLGIPSAALCAYQLLIGVVILAVVTPYTGITEVFTDMKATLALVIGMALLGTGFAYIIYYYLVKKLGAITASSVTFVPPVVALLIGSFVVGEPITLIDYGATALILAGVFLLKK